LLVAARSSLWVLARRHRYAELMRTIQVPVLLLHGAKDRLVPLAAAGAAAQNPAWRFAVARPDTSTYPAGPAVATVNKKPRCERPRASVSQRRWRRIDDRAGDPPEVSRPAVRR
jgi:alpha-beta hydrolase superfamily lysophospholipase